MFILYSSYCKQKSGTRNYEDIGMPPVDTSGN